MIEQFKIFVLQPTAKIDKKDQYRAGKVHLKLS